jgi:hypothetical protein
MGAFWEGEDIDPESGLSHVVKALATLVVMRDAMIQDKMCDDRPPKSPAGWLKELNAKAQKLIEQYPNTVPAYLATDQKKFEYTPAPGSLAEAFRTLDKLTKQEGTCKDPKCPICVHGKDCMCWHCRDERERSSGTQGGGT